MLRAGYLKLPVRIKSSQVQVEQHSCCGGPGERVGVESHVKIKDGKEEDPVQYFGWWV
jgi:hypothetical protein